MIAAFFGRHEALVALAQAGANVDASTPEDGSALHCATRVGHLECAASLTLLGAPVDAQDQQGETACHVAAKLSRLDHLHALTQAGADLNLTNKSGKAPIHVAAQSASLAAVSTLIKAGAQSTNPTPRAGRQSTARLGAASSPLLKRCRRPAPRCGAKIQPGKPLWIC
jgi:ankyrin repeat protein